MTSDLLVKIIFPTTPSSFLYKTNHQLKQRNPTEIKIRLKTSNKIIWLFYSSFFLLTLHHIYSSYLFLFSLATCNSSTFCLFWWTLRLRFAKQFHSTASSQRPPSSRRMWASSDLICQGSDGTEWLIRNPPRERAQTAAKAAAATFLHQAKPACLACAQDEQPHVSHPTETPSPCGPQNKHDS